MFIIILHSHSYAVAADRVQLKCGRVRWSANVKQYQPVFPSNPPCVGCIEFAKRPCVIDGYTNWEAEWNGTGCSPPHSLDLRAMICFFLFSHPFHILNYSLLIFPSQRGIRKIYSTRNSCVCLWHTRLWGAIAFNLFLQDVFWIFSF